MHPERDEAMIADAPEAVAESMSDATDRLRDQAWMVAPMTTGAIDTVSELARNAD